MRAPQAWLAVALLQFSTAQANDSGMVSAQARRYFERNRAALHIVAQKSSTAQQLEAVFRQHARWAMVERNGTVVGDSLGPTDFFVVAAVEDTMRVWDSFYLTAYYQSATQTVFLLYAEFQPLIHALILCHELSHVVQHLQDGLDLVAQPYLAAASEMTALLTADTVLNEYTGGDWQQFVEQRFAQRGYTTASAPPSIEALTSQDSAATRTRWHQYGDPDQSYLLGCLKYALSYRLHQLHSDYPAVVRHSFRNWIENTYPFGLAVQKNSR